MKEEKIDYRKIIEKIKPELEKAVNFLENELKNIRTGRARPEMIENLEVECFGQKFPLRQLAQISLPEPRQILIQPWDGSYIEGILKAIERSGLGLNPVVEKNFIRIYFPPLTEEFRKNLLKLVSQKKELAKKTIRRWREEAWDEIQEGFREGKISEDEKYKGKDELQELVDDYNEKIEELSDKKEKEILE
jgi:ribosome recycling factor